MNNNSRNEQRKSGSTGADVASEVFVKYANYYDSFYECKDYAAEVAFLERSLRQHAAGDIKNLLDIGCGTGSHAILLARRGFAVTGLDASEPMLAIARKKVRSSNVPVSLVCGDARSFDLGTTFDAIVSMFAALSYLTSNTDIANCFLTVRRHCRPGGLFIFDVWNGLAVMHDPPIPRVKEFSIGDITVLRTVEPHLDGVNHISRNRYVIWVRNGNRQIDTITEEHCVRFFFPQEIVRYLDEAGFDLVKMGAFPENDRPADEHAFNVSVIARARE